MSRHYPGFPKGGINPWPCLGRWSVWCEARRLPSLLCLLLVSQCRALTCVSWRTGWRMCRKYAIKASSSTSRLLALGVSAQRGSRGLLWERRSLLKDLCQINPHSARWIGEIYRDCIIVTWAPWVLISQAWKFHGTCSLAQIQFKFAFTSNLNETQTS